ncbi:MAG: hypothetical protein KF791_14250 [Verrucomicrobiae bacterium]|nr:hypothetical protein [Verrucomicrobiae bacterium]
MNRRAVLITVAASLVAAYAGRLAWRAHRDVVSLQAYDLPLRDVVRKLKWQTWESIEVSKDLDGRVNLNVTDQPLTVVLDLVAEQVNSQWAVAYPLYTTRDRLKTARRVAAGTAPQPAPGWTNWNARPNFAAMAARIQAALDGADASTNSGPMGLGFGGGPGGPGGPFEGGAALRPVTVEWREAAPLEAAQSLRQFGRVKVVPEDGTQLRINLTLKEAPMDTAVAKLAKASNRKWAKFYALEPQRRRERPSEEDREQFAQRMPNPEQMRARFEQMAQDPGFQERMEQRQIRSLLNSTPMQRAERDQRRRGGGGGGGGRGGPR